jgi:hypothetical protein
VALRFLDKCVATRDSLVLAIEEADNCSIAIRLDDAYRLVSCLGLINMNWGTNCVPPELKPYLTRDCLHICNKSLEDAFISIRCV